MTHRSLWLSPASCALLFACASPTPPLDGATSADATVTEAAATIDVVASPECAMATPIGAGATLVAQSFDGAPRRSYPSASGCSITANPTRFYAVTLQPAQQLRAEITRGDRLALQLVENDCGNTSCVASAESPSALLFTNGEAAPRLLYIGVVSTEFSPDPSATFDLAVTVTDVRPGLLCARPADVTSGARLTGQTFREGVDLREDVCRIGRSNAAFYRVTLPAGQRVSVAARATTFAPQLRILDGCASPMCLASAAARSDTARAATVSYANTTTAARSVIVTVNGYYNNVFGEFDLDVDVAP